jgi:hypothetical protein
MAREHVALLTSNEVALALSNFIIKRDDLGPVRLACAYDKVGATLPGHASITWCEIRGEGGKLDHIKVTLELP